LALGRGAGFAMDRCYAMGPRLRERLGGSLALPDARLANFG
jgi:hypothetical protein